MIKEAYKVLKVRYFYHMATDTIYAIFCCIVFYEYHAFHGCISQEGGELYYSDMYASKVTPDSFKEDPVLWGKRFFLFIFLYLLHLVMVLQNVVINICFIFTFRQACSMCVPRDTL